MERSFYQQPSLLFALVSVCISIAAFGCGGSVVESSTSGGNGGSGGEGGGGGSSSSGNPASCDSIKNGEPPTYAGEDAVSVSETHFPYETASAIWINIEGVCYFQNMAAKVTKVVPGSTAYFWLDSSDDPKQELNIQILGANGIPDAKFYYRCPGVSTASGLVNVPSEEWKSTTLPLEFSAYRVHGNPCAENGATGYNIAMVLAK